MIIFYLKLVQNYSVYVDQVYDDPIYDAYIMILTNIYPFAKRLAN
jgi:hypothetical protein